MRAMLRHLTSRQERTIPAGLSFDIDQIELEVIDGKSKSRLAERALQLGTATKRPDRIVVTFDPDNDPPASANQFFLKDFADHAGKKGPQMLSDGKGLYRTRLAGREVEIQLAPWRTSAPAVFDQAPTGENDLERVLIEGILGTAEQDTRAWAEQATTSLLQLAPDHGWKRAFRIWNAALGPKTESASFVERLLQAASTRERCLKALLDTPVGNALQWVLEA
ncbi:MAG: hypothetical protein HY898_01325 [Deltaproteobacteria bacterium]|nr:hypothetical protein [Deltaproteobacteria bacterium]